MIRLLRQRSKDDFELKSFTAHTAPPYAILSHTWTDGAEVTYDDLVASTGKDKAGYDKIRFCGQRAAEEGLEYFWVDTCCIDKSSSAELSESINSMYRWYQQADVCYAYIEDWPSELTWAELQSLESENEQSLESDDERSLESSKRNMANRCGSVHLGSEKDGRNDSAQSLEPAQSNSPRYSRSPLRWFTRGWTLQELIAPKKMEFFDGNQKSRGMKFDPLVVEELSRITGISASVLSDRSGDSLRGICYGQRMSWAAYRQTTRIEDIAYCLLGIFHIHMPLLYGEGVKAFTRLQEVILASSTDLSLLAWTQSPEDTQTYRGILSRHPHEFRYLRQLRLDSSQFSVQDEVIMTNKGARIETSLFQPVGHNHFPDLGVCFLSLGCYDGEYLQGIVLKKVNHVHVRAEPRGLILLNQFVRRAKAETIYLALDFDRLSNLEYDWKRIFGIEVWLNAPEPYGFVAVESWPSGYYDPLNKTFSVGHLAAFVGYLLIDVICCTSIDQGDMRKSIVRFMVVVTKGEHAGVVVNFLKKDQAEEFKMHMELISAMEPGTAHNSLASSMKNLWLDQEPLVLVQDHATNSVLSIEGKVVNRKSTTWTDSGENFPLKAVRISIKISS